MLLHGFGASTCLAWVFWSCPAAAASLAEKAFLCFNGFFSRPERFVLTLGGEAGAASASVANDVEGGVEKDVGNRPSELPELTLEVEAHAFLASSAKNVGESGKGGVENSDFAGTMGGDVVNRPPKWP